MADRWIITRQKWREHRTLERAQAELARLNGTPQLKEHTYRILRTKTTLDPDDDENLIGELLAALKYALDRAARHHIPRDDVVDTGLLIIKAERRLEGST